MYKRQQSKDDTVHHGTLQGLHTKLKHAMEQFETFFINTNTNSIKNKQLFMERCLGSVSYFSKVLSNSGEDGSRPVVFPEEKFFCQTVPVGLPIEDTSTSKTPCRIEIPMSSNQFREYTKARMQEISVELRRRYNQDKNGENNNMYRILSRQRCNFIFPPNIRRPRPKREDLMFPAVSYTHLTLPTTPYV